MALRWVALWILGVVLWLHTALLHDGGLLGAPRSDVIRAWWGLCLPVRALPDLPFWTDYIGFPAGAKVVVLPFVSTVVGSPLTALLGPVGGYDVWMLLLLWGTGVATAWAAMTWSESPAGGLLAGTWIVSQPMMFAALSDGTAEFVAFWSVPAALAALRRGREHVGWARAGALLLVVVALDSPYHAVFVLPFLPMAVWGMPRRQLLEMALVGVAGGVSVYGLYYGLPIAAPDTSGSNAVLLRIWNQWETGGTVRHWDWTLGAGFIPRVLLAGALLLASLRPLRALPWLLVAALALVWSLGAVEENAVWLTRWFGAAGEPLAKGTTWVNTHLVPPVVRFPRRWLVPVAFGTGMAAAIGLSRIPSERVRLAIAVPAAVAVVWVTGALTGYRDWLPHFHPPEPAFTTFVRDQPQSGAILALPRVRPARAAVDRDRLPVFASLSTDLASADMLYLQVATHRPSVYLPEGLRTIRQRYSLGAELDKLIHDLDDLTNPQTLGTPIPGSSVQEPSRRARAARTLVDAGLGFVLIDEATYGEEGLAYAKLAFAAVTREVRHFDDGTGVTVLVLGAPG